MALVDLHHIAIKVADLDSTNVFYCDVLGMRMVTRPEFSFPGSWLSFNNTMIHVMAGHAAADESGGVPRGTGAVDHIAISARNFDEMRTKLEARGIEWQQLYQPEAKLWQLFFRDPNGILIELNYSIPEEPAGSKGPDGTRVFEPGSLPLTGSSHVSPTATARALHGSK